MTIQSIIVYFHFDVSKRIDSIIVRISETKLLRYIIMYIYIQGNNNLKSCLFGNK
jgi:hypothetical protein